MQGFCDYLFSLEADSPLIEAPVFCVVEAKNDNLDTGIAQCIAEMYAAQLFNQKHNRPIETIYGAVTLGFEWQFMKLEGQTIFQDKDTYFLNQLPQLLGVLQAVVNSFK